MEKPSKKPAKVKNAKVVKSGKAKSFPVTSEEIRIQTAILQERERIGMDLHDGIIQALYGIGLNLQSVRLHLGEDPQVTDERLNQALLALDAAIRNIRIYILNLRPRRLQDKNLLAGMRGMVREFSANTLINVELDGCEEDVFDLSADNAMALFHIFQEALGNIARHAEATRVNVRVWRVNQRVMLKVSDDGVGFDTGRVESGLGHGLANMQTRAQNANGGIEIISIRKQGTTILAWVPLK
jgi:two-component system sensor histidine kinase DevS